MLKTTEEVSSHPGENGRWESKKASKQPCPENNRNGLEKSSCQAVEQEENREKGPDGSLARNHMGNPDLLRWAQRHINRDRHDERVQVPVLHLWATYKNRHNLRRHGFYVPKYKLP